MDGALLINKHAGLSSFGIIESLQRFLRETTGARRKDLPSLGHGGTLDPFATGLLIVCVGRGVKLSRYFLGSDKGYEGRMRFGETTASGDITNPVTETSPTLPESLEQLRTLAKKLTLQPYLQTPPMFSAKKRDGKPLYELAREGIEVDREPKLCHLHQFDIRNYEKPRAEFEVKCSSGTYIRTLAQDFARMMGTFAVLETLHRTSSGAFRNSDAWTVDQIIAASREDRKWSELPCWVPFDRMLQGHERVEATAEDVLAIHQGRQAILPGLLSRAQGDCVTIYHEDRLVAVARMTDAIWKLERVFPDLKLTS